jgi:hypothetical protein
MVRGGGRTPLRSPVTKIDGSILRPECMGSRS